MQKTERFYLMQLYEIARRAILHPNCAEFIKLTFYFAPADTST